MSGSNAAVEGLSGALGGVLALLVTYPLMTVSPSQWHELSCHLLQQPSCPSAGEKAVNTSASLIFLLTVMCEHLDKSMTAYQLSMDSHIPCQEGQNVRQGHCLLVRRQIQLLADETAKSNGSVGANPTSHQEERGEGAKGHSAHCACQETDRSPCRHC